MIFNRCIFSLIVLLVGGLALITNPSKLAAQQGLASSVEQVAGQIPAPNQDKRRVTPQQVVRLSPGSILEGTVSVVAGGGLQNVPSGTSVRLIRQGRVIERTETDREGNFALRRVEQGVQTIVASGNEMLAVYAVTVIMDDQATETSLDLVAASQVPLSRSLAMYAGLKQMQSVSDQLGARFDLEVRGTMEAYRVQLDPAGGFSGMVSVPGMPWESIDLTGTQLRVYRNGNLIRETNVKASGEYNVPNVGAGPASVFVFGPKGYAAAGIQLVPAIVQADLRSTNEYFVSRRQDPVQQFNIDIAPLSDIEPAFNELEEEFQQNGINSASIDIPPPIAGSGFAGGAPGSGFGGGGGGGSGGIGALAGLGALGAALAAGLGSDSGSDFTPAPASPAIP